MDSLVALRYTVYPTRGGSPTSRSGVHAVHSTVIVDDVIFVIMGWSLSIGSSAKTKAKRYTLYAKNEDGLLL